MPRVARNYSELKVYHITIRGIDKQNIFFDDDDRCKFIDIINDTKEKFNYDIYSYCLMDNHVHFIIYDKNKKISKIMQSIQVSYAFYFNKKYERVGHLFQNRFFSKEVGDREYLKMVCRYIHQNPLKAGIAKTEEYKWSSYQSLLNIKNIEEISRYNAEIRNEKLLKLKCLKNIPLTQLSRIIGINRKIIERVIKK